MNPMSEAKPSEVLTLLAERISDPEKWIRGATEEGAKKGCLLWHLAKMYDIPFEMKSLVTVSQTIVPIPPKIHEFVGEQKDGALFQFKTFVEDKFEVKWIPTIPYRELRKLPVMEFLGATASARLGRMVHMTLKGQIEYGRVKESVIAITTFNDRMSHTNAVGLCHEAALLAKQSDQ